MASETTRAQGATTDAAIHVIPGRTPLVFDSPHSGTVYPSDFAYSCNLADLRTAEDTHVEKLYDFAPALGIAWIEALFPRSYLDANRSDADIDVAMMEGAWTWPVTDDPYAQAKVRLGKGLIWRNTDEGVPMYAGKLAVEHVRGRIERCWQPYHAAVVQAIEAAHARHGYSIHMNCHSMPAIAGSHATDYPGIAHADFVFGDRDGTTADPRLTALLADFLRRRGYSVEVNFPYKGVELVKRYGDPASHRHSIQLETNRKLYMDEATFELTPGAERVRADLRALAELMLTIDPRRL
jgi:N-formylglutamate deformylase